MSGAQVVFGWPARHPGAPHAFRLTADHTLCGLAKDEGRSPSFVPPQPPGWVPQDLCGDCGAVMRAGKMRPVRDEQAEGICPECVGPALLDGRGRISAHQAWTWAHGGVATVSRVACDGAGQWPEEGE